MVENKFVVYEAQEKSQPFSVDLPEGKFEFQVSRVAYPWELDNGANGISDRVRIKFGKLNDRGFVARFKQINFPIMPKQDLQEIFDRIMVEQKKEVEIPQEDVEDEGE